MKVRLATLLCIAMTATARAQAIPRATERAPRDGYVRGKLWRECESERKLPCTPGRHIPNELNGFATPGAWLIRDATAFARFWDEHPSGSDRQVSRPAINWTREYILVASIGGYGGCGPERVVNRIVQRADTTIVVIGPDAIIPERLDVCAGWYETPDIVAIPVVRGPVVVRGARPDTHADQIILHVLP